MKRMLNSKLCGVNINLLAVFLLNEEHVNFSVVSAVTAGGERLFQCGIVKGKTNPGLNLQY